MKRWLVIVGLFLASVAWAAPPAPTGVTVTSPSHDDGLSLTVAWEPAAGATGYAVVRSTRPDGPWVLAADALAADKTSVKDRVLDRPAPFVDRPEEAYYYRVLSLHAGTPTFVQPEGSKEELKAAKAAHLEMLLDRAPSSAVAEGQPEGSWVHTGLGRIHLLLIILAFTAMILWFADQARKGREIFVRRIPGIDAIEEGIGRATEMGRPVLYVPGVDELQDIQTIAAMLILGEVSKTVAEYQSDIVVSCRIPIVREVADEVVRAGFYEAGHPDAYNPSMVRFISSDQFAFTAGTNGIILREKPATNLYLGRFFAESLILAETGFVNRSIQIAGTAAASQLPFFVAACDYTLIGEELYAVSAYLSKDPRLVSSLKASDIVKLYCVFLIVIGTIAATLGSDVIAVLVQIAE